MGCGSSIPIENPIDEKLLETIKGIIDRTLVPWVETLQKDMTDLFNKELDDCQKKGTKYDASKFETQFDKILKDHDPEKLKNDVNKETIKEVDPTLETKLKSMNDLTKRAAKQLAEETIEQSINAAYDKAVDTLKAEVKKLVA